MSNPADGYLTVTTEELEAVRRERVHELEIAHARTVLLCREVHGTPAAATSGHFDQLADIARRIEVHVGGGDGAHAAAPAAAEELPEMAPIGDQAAPGGPDVFAPHETVTTARVDPQ